KANCRLFRCPLAPKDPTPVPAAAPCRTPFIIPTRPTSALCCRRAREFRLPPGRTAQRRAAMSAARTVTAALCTDNSGATLRVAPTCLYRLGHRSLRGAADQARVLCEHAALRIGPGRAPGGAPAPQLRRGQLDVQLPSHRVDADPVTVAQQCDRSADGGLGRDVPHDEAVTAPGETPIRDEGHLRAETASH